MKTLREAATLALEVLIAATPVKAKDPQMQADAINALREALAAQDKQDETRDNLERYTQEVRNIMAHKPLTDKDIDKLMMRTWGSVSIAPQSVPEFARAIERAHGIGGKE